jgi:hypothetical protein
MNTDPRPLCLGLAFVAVSWLIPLSAAAQGADGLEVQRAANDRISIDAQDVRVDDILVRLAEILDAEIIGVETIPTDRRVTGSIELPLDRVLAWLVPDASYAMYWSPGGGWDSGESGAKRLRIVFFPEGQAGSPISAGRSRGFRGFRRDAGLAGETADGTGRGATGGRRLSGQVVRQASDEPTDQELIDPSGQEVIADPTGQDPFAGQDPAYDQGPTPEQDPSLLEQGDDQGAIPDPLSQEQPY